MTPKTETDGQVISIIVPIYDVEPYLRKCLDSIADQTYRNLEIILVDDGSPDNCPAICDEYAAKDERVKVIHKENGGVASARNAGLDAATGEWIGWVDPDDWVELDMFEFLLVGALQNGADISVCGRYEVSRGHKISRNWKETLELDREQAMDLLLKNDMLQNYCWDKLFLRKLWDGVRFPKFKAYEDVAIMLRLFQQVGKVVCLPGEKYYYRFRQGSLTGEQDLEKRVGYYRASQARYEAITAEWPQFTPLLAGQCVGAAVALWTAYFGSEKQLRRAFLPQLREISKFCSAHLQEALETMTLGPVGRFVIRLTPYPTWWAFTLAGIASKVYERKHGRPL